MAKTADILARLCTVFGREITDDLVLEYRKAFGEVDPGLLELAVDDVVETCKYMPRPAEILSVIKRIQAESARTNAEPEHWRRDTYQCLDCQDTGWITVWDPVAMRSALDIASGKITRELLRPNSAVAKCTCRIGQSRKVEALTYRSPPMIRIDPGLPFPAQVEELLAWAQSRGRRPSNYVSEFDDFNRSEKSAPGEVSSCTPPENVAASPP